MEYNWPAVMKEFNKIVGENVLIFKDAKDKKPDPAWTADFRIQLFRCDSFHPYDSDNELSRALSRMPAGRRNYRSCDAYWEYAERKDDVLDAVYIMLEEAGDRIRAHYQEEWNFPPEIELPPKVVAPDDGTVLNERTLISRILRAARS